jgi:ubiquitin-like protein Pup
MATHETGGGQARSNRKREDGAEEAAEAPTDLQERHEKLTEDVDAMLDEIDDVLEENAEEFVRGYVQKGGE